MDAVIANLPRSEAVYERCLEGLTGVNEWIYRNTQLASIYNGRVKYRRETGEVWRHAGDVVGDGWGDCEDLACARAGELRAKGERRARVVVVRTGPTMTHAVVKRGNGKLEDPSRKLGMGRETVVSEGEVMGYSSRSSGTGEDDDEIGGDGSYEAIGADVSRSTEVTWTIDRTPTGWKGTVRVPLDAGRALVVARTSTKPGSAGKKEAGQSALAAASKVLDSPLAKALIPPQAALALNLVRNPASMKALNATIGKLKSLF